MESLSYETSGLPDVNLDVDLGGLGDSHDELHRTSVDTASLPANDVDVDSASRPSVAEEGEEEFDPFEPLPELPSSFSLDGLSDPSLQAGHFGGGGGGGGGAVLPSGPLGKPLHSLIQPIPNLFRTIFQSARAHSEGETWLLQQIQIFDKGNKAERKQVLENFLEYVSTSNASRMEDLFSKQAHLLFIRLSTWFANMLPKRYELPLQLKVFLTFLDFREQTFIRAFFESGTIVPLMHALSVDYDVPDDVRCLAILVLHKLSSPGRQHKEILCSRGIIGRILECVSDGLKWETLKVGGRLLVELFQGNPRYQSKVLDALQDFMAQRLPLTQRVGTQALISLLSPEAHDLAQPLCDPRRHRDMVQRALALLESGDLRVSADAYCLLCRLLRVFDCDILLGDFARRHLRMNLENAQEWLRIEQESATAEESTNVLSGRHSHTINRLHSSITQALSKTGATAEAETDSVDHPSASLMRGINATNAEFCEAFRAEASYILKWGLLLYLSKRSDELCNELVEGGLTETLLMCVLDVAHPVRQAAALAELHRLQLISPKAKNITKAVLHHQKLLQALTLDQFMAASTPETLKLARARLRNLQQMGDRRVSATEHVLQQQLMEQEVNTAVGASGVSSKVDVFLTAAGEANEQEAEESLPRTGPSIFPGQRLPAGPEANGEAYYFDRGSVEEIPFQGTLASFLSDPLGLMADEESPLLAEVRMLESKVQNRFSNFCSRANGPELSQLAATGFSKAGTTTLGATARSTGLSKRQLAQKKPKAHRPTPEHVRAVALRGLGAEPMPLSIRAAAAAAKPERTRPLSVLSAAHSEETDISLHMVPIDESLDDVASRDWHCCHSHSSDSGIPRIKLSVHDSLADTTLGAGPTHELSSIEEFSGDHYHLTSDDDPFNTEQSTHTLGTDSLEFPSKRSFDRHLDSIPDLGSSSDSSGVRLQATVVRKSALTADVEVHRWTKVEGDFGPGSLPMVNQGLEEARLHKRVLRVTQPPYHDCIAFDRSDWIEHRLREAQVPSHIHPETQQRLKDLKQTGSFARRSVAPKGGPPHSARLAYKPVERYEEERARGGKLKMAGAALFSARGSNPNNHGHSYDGSSRTGSEPKTSPPISLYAPSDIDFALLPDLDFDDLDEDFRPRRRFPKMPGKGDIQNFFPASARARNPSK